MYIRGNDSFFKPQSTLNSVCLLPQNVSSEMNSRHEIEFEVLFTLHTLIPNNDSSKGSWWSHKIYVDGTSQLSN